MPLADSNIWYGRGLLAVGFLILTLIIFWLWQASRKPENKGTY